MITTERLKELVDYNPETGIFRWKISVGKKRIGRIIGSLHSLGYKEAKIEGHRVFLHRIAWQYIYGDAPINQIDHINGDRTDNRIANLREATQQQNSRNMKLRPNNSSGFKSVYYHKKNKKWIAQICINYKVKYIGSFTSAEEAHTAYVKQAKEKFGQFARVG